MSDPTEQTLGSDERSLENPQALLEADDAASAAPPLAPVDADGYTKLGPGPMAAIRLKWRVRRGHGDEFFVDEMIGENATPVVLGPMSADAAVEMVDHRESAARAGFEQLRRQMIARSPAVDAAEVIQPTDDI